MTNSYSVVMPRLRWLLQSIQLFERFEAIRLRGFQDKQLSLAYQFQLLFELLDAPLRIPISDEHSFDEHA